MICEQREVTSTEVRVEMFHSPDGGLHLQQVGRIVFLMLHQLPAGVRNDLVFSFDFDLSENCTKPPSFF